MTAAEPTYRIRELLALPGAPSRRTLERRVECGKLLSFPSGRDGAAEIPESALWPEAREYLEKQRGEGTPPAAGAPPPASDDPRVDARLAILGAFERFHRDSELTVVEALHTFAALYNTTGAGLPDWVRETVRRFSWNTAQRWRNALRKHGPRGLERRKTGRESIIDADPELCEFLTARLLPNAKHTSAQHLREAARAKFPEREMPAISAFRRWSARFRAKNAWLLSAVSDPDGHRSKRMPAFGSASEAITALNAVWELDSTPADVICADGRRYAIVGAIDIWSRRTMVLVAETSRATAIAALLRRAILAWGVPEWVRTDEGGDYTSKHLRQALADLGIGHQALRPYSPDEKPFIERFLGTLARDLFSQLPGFIGHSVADRQEIRARQGFAARRGKGDKELYRAELTRDDLQEHCDVWCDAVYGRRAHDGLRGMSPFQKAASWGRPVRRIEDERALDILLAEPAGNGVRVVHKDGIRVDRGRYIATELGPMVGERVLVRRDPADLGRIFVFAAENGGFLAIAEDPERAGIDRQAVAAEAKRLHRARSNAARKLARKLAKGHPNDEAIRAVLDHAATEADSVVAFEPKSQAHNTDALDEAAEAADARDAAAPAPPRPAPRARTGKELLEDARRRQALVEKLRASG